MRIMPPKTRISGKIEGPDTAAGFSMPGSFGVLGRETDGAFGALKEGILGAAAPPPCGIAIFGSWGADGIAGIAGALISKPAPPPGGGLAGVGKATGGGIGAEMGDGATGAWASNGGAADGVPEKTVCCSAEVSKSLPTGI